MHYNQQQFVSSTNSGSNVIGGVSNVSNESNVIGAQSVSGVRTQSTAVIGSGNNNASASGIIIGNQSSGTVSVFGSNIGANSGSTYIQTASGIVTGTSAGAVVDPVGAVPVSPTARKRLKLEQNPVVEVEHDISALKKLILEHKYMRLRSIKEK